MQSRYHRQILLGQIGETGQRALADARVLLVGCGALGTVLAESLVRAGVGHLTLCDRDIVETTNLQRQTLYTQADVGASKAACAADRLRQVNADVTVTPEPVDVHSGNLPALAEGMSLLLDGTDNAATRYLINDVAVKHRLPWVYGAAVSTEGRVMPILPEGACLRCVFPTMPAAGELATCDTAGVLGPAAGVVANLQAALAIQILVTGDAPRKLHALDVWTGHVQTMDVSKARHPDCPCCGRGDHTFLNAPPADAISLCGRDTYQIRPAGASLDLAEVAVKLSRLGQVQRLPHLLRFQPEDHAASMALFADGRALIQDATDPATARGLYARYVGG